MRTVPLPRICTVCNQPYVKKPKEAAYTFQRRRFCSQICSRKQMKQDTAKFREGQQL
jgi:hypothetical protein